MHAILIVNFAAILKLIIRQYRLYLTIQGDRAENG
jgi:hypothetical protein